nr:hypothetical protein [Lysinibacillus timonensis]
MRLDQVIKVSGLSLALLVASQVAPNVLSEEGIVAHANGLSNISTTDYDNLDRTEHENDIDLSELRQITVKAAIDEINLHRKGMGVKPLQIGDDLVQEIVYKHLRYTSIEEEYSHYQNNKTSKYYIGNSFSDRIKTLGSFEKKYNFYTENITFSDSGEANIVGKYMLQNDKFNEEHYIAYVKDEVRGLINAPYHGASMLAPYQEYANADIYVDKETKHSSLGVTLYSDVDVYDTDIEELAKPYFYPYNNQKGLPTFMSSGEESPDPIKEAGLSVGGTPLIAYNYYPNVDSIDTAIVESAILTNVKTGKTITTKKIGQSKYAQGRYSLFIPVEKLSPYTAYKVVYTYNEPNELYANGTEKQYTVTFTTGSDTTDIDSIQETSPTTYEYKGKTYDMSTYVNNDVNTDDTTPVTPVEDGKTTTKLIKTTDASKLSNYLKEAKIQFIDFKADQYWADAITWMYANEILAGSSTKTKIKGTNEYYRQFMPNSNLTETQLLAMLFRYTANDDISNFPSSEQDYGVVYYNMAKAIGLTTKGDAGENRAKGNQAITREEMAILFVQTITGEKMNGREAIQFLYDNDISSGLSATRTVNRIQTKADGTQYTVQAQETYSPKTYESFNPKGKLTRAHVSAFFYRTQQQIEAGKITINDNF